jgi:hypothetical protein
MQRLEQRKKRYVPVAPILSPKFSPGLADQYTTRKSV